MSWRHIAKRYQDSPSPRCDIWPRGITMICHEHMWRCMCHLRASPWHASRCYAVMDQHGLYSCGTSCRKTITRHHHGRWSRYIVMTYHDHVWRRCMIMIHRLKIASWTVVMLDFRDIVVYQGVYNDGIAGKGIMILCQDAVSWCKTMMARLQDVGTLFHHNITSGEMMTMHHHCTSWRLSIMIHHRHGVARW